MKKNKMRKNHAYLLAWFQDENITEFVIFFYVTVIKQAWVKYFLRLDTHSYDS